MLPCICCKMLSVYCQKQCCVGYHAMTKAFCNFAFSRSFPGSQHLGACFKPALFRDEGVAPAVTEATPSRRDGQGHWHRPKAVGTQEVPVIQTEGGLEGSLEEVASKG